MLKFEVRARRFDLRPVRFLRARTFRAGAGRRPFRKPVPAR
jgi:hypothetical protein